jgi:hypothetical protein
MADTGYFLTVDVLGFGRIIKNSTESELESRITRWTSLVDVTAKKHGIEKLQLISDTVFVGVDSSEAGLSALLAFSRDLLSSGVDQSLPVRGALVHGSYTWGKLTYGKAVIAAHELEQAQNWIGIACSHNLPGIEGMWSLDKLVCYPAPQKRGSMQLHPVVSWPIPDTKTLMNRLASGGLVRNQEVLTWELVEKANNTILFRLYLECLRKQGLDCTKFYGTLPVHAVEAGFSSQ